MKICKHCGVAFGITDKELEFYEKVSPVFSSPSPADIPLNGGGTKEGVIKLENGKIKYLIPTPTLCPDCRQQRRMVFRNFMKLYTIKSSNSDTTILSMYKPGDSFSIYDIDYWWSDKWDAMDYGIDIKDIDFGIPFFNIFKGLLNVVPKMGIMNVKSENTHFSNMVFGSQNCYLVFGCLENEDCLYGHIVWYSKKCIDCLYVYKSELCYMCTDCTDCFGLYHCLDCNNCSNCFGCIGLENKSYYIYNKKYKKEDYEEKIKSIIFDGEKFQSLFKNKIVKYYHGYNSENITGDYIYNSENILTAFDIKGSENLKYCTTIGDFQNSMDSIFSGTKGEFMYETVFAQGYNVSFAHNCGNNCSSILYCDNCYSCQNCFGCVGLKNKSYCILNKQFTKEEYEILVPKIISHMMKTGEWGEFFPSSLSPFGYNETVAQEYFPLTKKEALEKGFNWSNYEAPFPKVEKIIPASKLPDDISKIPDDILNWAIECEITKKPFKIISQELEFYRKHNLPLPRRHPDQRHLDRMSLRNPRKLYTRKCDKCKKNIQTTYAPERPEKVYCEECYNKEVY